MIGRAPAKLLDRLVGERLAALAIVGPHIDVDERPGILVAQFGAETVDLIVVAVYRDQRRPVDRRTEDFARLKIGRDKDERFESGAGRVRRDGVGKIAGAGAGERGEAEFARTAR